MLRQLFSVILKELVDRISSFLSTFFRIRVRAVPTLLCSFANRFTFLRYAVILRLAQKPINAKINYYSSLLTFITFKIILFQLLSVAGVLCAMHTAVVIVAVCVDDSLC